MKRGDWH
jgi:NADH:ubiquinone oxidoreductase subunit F (NADH-binding)